MSITLMQKYIPLLDEVYATSATSSILDGTEIASASAQANTFLVPKMSMDGLGDYDRTNGYAAGSVSISYETKTPDLDRGRKFNVDAMDNEETAGIAFGKLSSEFVRTKVAPEMDAYRFAKYAAAAGTKVTGSLSTADGVLAALVAAQTAMDEAEVPTEERILFVTPTVLNLAHSADLTKSTAVLDSFTQIVKVPQTRFYTAIDLADGTSSGETAGGYSKTASTGKDINFLVIQKQAPIQFMKHNVNKIVTPEENQTADAWMFFYRAYGYCGAYENKVKGIYLHSKA